MFTARLLRLTLLVVAIAGARFARGEDFPSEMVDFVPYDMNPVFTAEGPGHWDVKIRERGWVERDKDGYHLWFTGYDGTNTGTRLLGYATSADGLRWQAFAGNPLDRERWIEDMLVVKDSSRYVMVAEGREDIAQLLTSPDRIHWTRQGALDVRHTDGQPIEQGPYGTPVLWHEKGTWYLFYERGDQAVWLATSKDLRTWTNTSDKPVLERGPTPCDRYAVAMNQVVKYRDWYYAYYHGADTPQWKRWSTSVARSRDLMHWEKFAHNPLVENNESSGILVDDGLRFRLYTMHEQVRVRFSREASQGRLEQPE